MEDNYNFPNEMERANDLIKNAEGIIINHLAEAREAENLEKQQKLETLLKKVRLDDTLFTRNFELRKKIIDEYPAFLEELYNEFK
jgi:hypothetical protein